MNRSKAPFASVIQVALDLDCSDPHDAGFIEAFIPISLIMTAWKQAILEWRALPEEERHRRRVLGLPRKVARSMALEGEPVSAEMLEEIVERDYPELFAAVPGATAARFALVGPSLPPVEEALCVGECLRQAVMSLAGKVLGNTRIPAVLSGHDLPAGNRHGHAFYLAEDADGDGRIDHLTVYVPGGVDQECHRVLVRLTRLWKREGQSWRVLLEAVSDTNVFAGSSTLFGIGRRWTSVTPYLHPWHMKKKFTVTDQIRRECKERALPEIRHLVRLPSIKIQGRELRPVHFHRSRVKRNLVQPDTRGSFWCIEFAGPVQGPLALGFACHFGLGLFGRAD
ncbi:MAG TPA: type I-U CRISPR-associated protein Cas5/Cas6 [Rhodospirillales bacterium]|nr:type I-U CRISPR-associated protein Cas5/Cas6 [Rhodospirillales bacterium]